MFTGRKLFVTLVTMCCLFIPSHFIQFVYASVCHDGAWDPGEYCGYDAVATTTNHVCDMNHDCLVDGLDFQLFCQEYVGVGSTGPNLSGDFKSTGSPGPPPCPGDQLCPDNKVTLADYSFFTTKVGQTASPCTSVPIPSVCGGTIALSFSPSSIVKTATQPTGQLLNAYVVVSGVTNAQMVEFSLMRSPNVQVLNFVVNDANTDTYAPICYPVGYQDDQVVYLGTQIASGPAVAVTIQYILADTKAAWISVANSNCPYGQTRWTDSSVSVSHLFSSMSGVGINGGTASGGNACGPFGQISGKVYSDKDFNCAYTSGTDDVLAGLTVQATPGPYYALTDASGNYTLKVPAGPTYTVKMAPTANDPWKKLSACQSPVTYPVPVAANGVYPNKDFAMLPIAKITGQVYRDFSNTIACVKDGGDLPVPSRMMLASAGNYIGYTDQNGNYAIDVPAGTYLLSNYPLNIDPYTVRSCQSSTYNVMLAANATATGKDFAMDINPSYPCNVFLNVSSHGVDYGPAPCTHIRPWPCPGKEWEYLVTLSEDVLSGVLLGNVAQIDIVLDPTFTISTVTSDCSISIVSSPNAHERVVAVTTSMDPGQQCVIKVKGTPATGGPYTTTVTLNDQGKCAGTKVRTLTETSRCSCDPNDMFVQPGCGPDGQVAQDTPLTYTVQFENVGTGRAHNIFIEDVLDEDLDVSTVSIVSSSHPVTGVQVNGGNKLEISFEGIDLAGTLGPESNDGQVIFAVRPLPIEDQNDSYVENSAAITFDFNDPVITNTVVTTFVDDPCVATAVNHDPLPLSNYLGSNYPNPFNPATTITYGLAAHGHVTIAIYNINGSLIRTLVSNDKPAGWYTVDWDGRDQRGNQVASGVYFSQMRAGSFSGSKKLVLLK